MDTDAATVKSETVDEDLHCIDTDVNAAEPQAVDENVEYTP